MSEALLTALGGTAGTPRELERPPAGSRYVVEGRYHAAARRYCWRGFTTYQGALSQLAHERAEAEAVGYAVVLTLSRDGRCLRRVRTGGDA